MISLLFLLTCKDGQNWKYLQHRCKHLLDAGGEKQPDAASGFDWNSTVVYFKWVFVFLISCISTRQWAFSFFSFITCAFLQLVVWLFSWNHLVGFEQLRVLLIINPWIGEAQIFLLLPGLSSICLHKYFQWVQEKYWQSYLAVNLITSVGVRSKK